MDYLFSACLPQWSVWDQTLLKNGKDLISSINEITEVFGKWKQTLDSHVSMFQQTLPQSQPSIEMLTEIQKEYATITSIKNDAFLRQVQARLLMDPKHAPSEDSLCLIAASHDITLNELRSNIKRLQGHTEKLENMQKLVLETLLAMETARNAFEQSFNLLTYLTSCNVSWIANKTCFDAGYQLGFHCQVVRPLQMNSPAQAFSGNYLHRTVPWNKEKLDSDYLLESNCAGLITRMEQVITQCKEMNTTVKKWLEKSEKAAPNTIKDTYKSIDFERIARDYQQLKQAIAVRVKEDCKNKISNLGLSTIALANDITVEEIELNLVNFKKQTKALNDSVNKAEAVLEEMNATVLTLQRTFNLFAYLQEKALPYCAENEFYFDIESKLKIFDYIHQR